MDCRKCQSLLNAYLDGELEGRQFAELERHVERCPDCKAELERMMRMRELLRELSEVEVPLGAREAFIGALRDRIEAEEKRAYRREINWRPALIGGIVVTLILIVLVTLPRTRPAPTIAPAPGLNALENALVDSVIVGALHNHILATSGEFMSDAQTTAGQSLAVWKVVKQTHGELFEPAPAE